VCSEAACEECKRFDGLHFLPPELTKYRTPISTCKYPVCWCEVVGVYSDEGTIVSTDPAGERLTHHQPGDAADIVDFLQKSSGVASKEQIDAHVNAQLAPERERAAREHTNVELWSRAYRLEKDSPEESISLYRQSVQAWKATLRADAGSRWDYLEDSYNRLTLILEKSKRFSEALCEIDDYCAFSAEMGRKKPVETIAKRAARLKKKIH
jgi:hypothetical protein